MDEIIGGIMLKVYIEHGSVRYPSHVYGFVPSKKYPGHLKK